MGAALIGAIAGAFMVACVTYFFAKNRDAAERDLISAHAAEQKQMLVAYVAAATANLAAQTSAAKETLAESVAAEKEALARSSVAARTGTDPRYVAEWLSRQ